MEIQLVHTTGSPSRHDSDSGSSYEKKGRTISSSDVALHRKQSRRCRKQMSERQRRKRMNISMDKLGLLVYGKTFKEGLKVDKATLLKDAYEKLQTMKDDYHKGYETAIASTQNFLDGLDSCPQEVKDALNRHLNSTLQINLHRCHSTSSALPADDSNSDSCSPQPLRSSVLESASGQDCLSVDVNSRPSSLQQAPSNSIFNNAELLCGLGEKDAFRAARSSTVHPHSRVPELQASTPNKTVAQVAPLSDYSSNNNSNSAGANTITSSGSRCEAERNLVSQTVGSSSGSGPIGSSSLQKTSWPNVSADGSTPTRRRENTPGPQYHHPYTPTLHYLPYTPKGSPSASTTITSTNTPKISPYVTPYAPQNPLYLGSCPPSLLTGTPVYGVPEPEYSGSSSRFGPHPPYRPVSQPLSALSPKRFGGPSRADDSGYISPVVPSPRTPVGSNGRVYDSLKKRYLRVMMMMNSHEREVEEDTDDENDREVERVFSRTSKYRPNSASSHSE